MTFRDGASSPITDTLGGNLARRYESEQRASVLPG